MPNARTIGLLLFILFFQTRLLVFCQDSLPVKQLVAVFESQDETQVRHSPFFNQDRFQTDNVYASSIIQALEKNVPASNHYFNARLLHLKSLFQLCYNFSKGKMVAKDLCVQALGEAHFTGDKSFVAIISWYYGSLMQSFLEIELGAAYLLNAVEFHKTIFNLTRDSSAIQYLGEMLFHAKIYDQSVLYTRTAIDSLRSWKQDSTRNCIRAWNTLGQGYQQLNKLDSALISYKISSDLAYHTKDTVWQGINAGFMGQVYFLQGQYDAAKRLLEYDISMNRSRVQLIAAYSLQWLGRLYLKIGRSDSALPKIKEALTLLEQQNNPGYQTKPYQEAAYYAMADAYRMKGNSDSFYHYSLLYSHLHDSLQAVAARSSLDVAHMRIGQEKSVNAVLRLQKEKRSEEQARNFIIASILFFLIVSLLLLNRQRQRLKFQRQIALRQKAETEAEKAAATEQLHLFTQSITEKKELIEKLQQQLQTREITTEQQAIINELSEQTILTEMDWERFRRLFEKLHPGFLSRLKLQAPEITIAEQRMAAIIRLQLTSKQTAAMLGISVDSVRKTRQRLRQRLHIPAGDNLEEAITGY